MDRISKRMCIYGLGGIGGYLGGMLAYNAGKSEEGSIEVYFAARGKHLDAIKSSGLTLITPSKGSISCHPTEAVEKINGLPVMDYIFLCVKGYDLDAAVEEISSIAGEDTVIIAPLNGVDIYERIRFKVKNGIILPSAIFITSSIQEAGVVFHKGGTTKLVLGKDPEHADYEPKPLLDILDAAEIPYKWEEDALPTIWEKFFMFAPFALVTAYSGKTFGQVMEDKDLKSMVKAIMKEVVAIAKAKGIPVKDSIIETYLGNASFYPYETKTSYQRDIEGGKGKDEGDLIGGTIIRLGKQYGVSTANTERIYRQRRDI